MLPDEIEARRIRERNIKGCNALLALLQMHHGNGELVELEILQELTTPIEEDLVEIIEPEPPVQSSPDQETEWLTRQKAIWFSIENEEKKPLKIEAIQAAVAKEYGISRHDILTAVRIQKVAFPRQVAMYLSKTMLCKSLPEIGRRFGGRDHTTVLHSVRKIERLMATDEALSARVQSLTARLST